MKPWASLGQLGLGAQQCTAGRLTCFCKYLTGSNCSFAATPQQALLLGNVPMFILLLQVKNVNVLFSSISSVFASLCFAEHLSPCWAPWQLRCVSVMQAVLTGCQAQNAPGAALGELSSHPSLSNPGLERECQGLPGPALGMDSQSTEPFSREKSFKMKDPTMKAALPSPSLLILLPSSSLSCSCWHPEQGGAGETGSAGNP